MNFHARILVSVGIVAFGAPASAQCVRPQLSVASWPMAQSPRLPGLRLRLPHSFVRDTTGWPFPDRPIPHGSRWVGPGAAQLSVFIVDSTGQLFTRLPQSTDDRAEFSRCEEDVTGGHLTVVSYNKREAAGDMAFAGPFQVFAAYRSRRGVVQLYAMCATRDAFEQLLAAAHTLRLRDD